MDVARRHRGRPAPPRRPRGSVVIIVLWTISVAVLLVSSVQLFAYRQATLGRDTLSRTQARWAARSGVENTIAILALHTTDPIPEDAFALIDDLEDVARGELHRARYDITHHVAGRDWDGPMDEHSKINLNGPTNALDYRLLDDLTPDVAASIVDWADADDEPSLLGAERDWYLSLQTPIEPRNGPFRSIAELELVAGVWPEIVRGEDWNLNNVRNANEDDGLRSLPEDEPDGVLDAGWSARLTVHSVGGGATVSGEPRLYLRRADPLDLMDRCGVDEMQAEALIDFGGNDQNTLESLITTPLTGAAGAGGAEQPQQVAPLTDEQLRAVMAETSVLPLYERPAGKINLNTAAADLIRDLLLVQGIDEAFGDEIVYLRDSRAEGLTSILDLDAIQGMTPQLLQQLAGTFTTISNVYTITSRGRSSTGRHEAEIIVTVDRSTVPVRILEYREQ